MKIKITSVMVNDQEKALEFYTEVLGFVKKTDVPAGEYRWLTIVSPDDPQGVELLLEPMGFAPARTRKPCTMPASPRPCSWWTTSTGNTRDWKPSA